MSFLEVSKEILKVSKKYGDINSEIQNIFEISFLTFMDIIKSLDENLPINEGTIKSKVFDDLFGQQPNKGQCGITSQKESTDIDNDLFKEITGNNSNVSTDAIGGFDPNDNPNAPDITLLSDLKNKIQNINKEKLEQKNKKVLDDFKGKSKE
jgi:hypothetical protein